MVGGAGEQVLAVEPVARRRKTEVPSGYAQVNVTAAPVMVGGARGIDGMQRSTTEDNVYCFDPTFVPKAAVASAHLNNDSTVGTVPGSGVPSGCPAGFRDVAARTYAANTSAPSSEVNFGITFIQRGVFGRVRRVCKSPTFGPLAPWRAATPPGSGARRR